MLRTKLVKTQKGEEKLESSTRQCCEPGRTERGGDNVCLGTATAGLCCRNLTVTFAWLEYKEYKTPGLQSRNESPRATSAIVRKGITMSQALIRNTSLAWTAKEGPAAFWKWVWECLLFPWWQEPRRSQDTCLWREAELGLGTGPLWGGRTCSAQLSQRAWWYFFGQNRSLLKKIK